VTNILIRDVPDDVVAALDARAASLGLSRNEFLRRRMAQEARRSPSPVTAEDLRQFADLAADLGDPEVMARAWS
jgi:plasmid stability protein